MCVFTYTATIVGLALISYETQLAMTLTGRHPFSPSFKQLSSERKRKCMFAELNAVVQVCMHAYGNPCTVSISAVVHTCLQLQCAWSVGVESSSVLYICIGKQ